MAGRAISSIIRAVFVMSFMWGCYCCVGQQGRATFYTPPYVPTACRGYDQNQFPAASSTIWGNGAACGCTGATNQGVPMPCKSGSIVVKILDHCPAGCRGTYDLSPQAFAYIGNPDAGNVYIDSDGGKIDINYQQA